MCTDNGRTCGEMPLDSWILAHSSILGKIPEADSAL